MAQTELKTWAFYQIEIKEPIYIAQENCVLHKVTSIRVTKKLPELSQDFRSNFKIFSGLFNIKSNKYSHDSSSIIGELWNP